MTIPAAFHWLDTHPAAYWTGAFFATGTLVLAAISARQVESTPGKSSARRWLFPLLLLLLLIAWRWPYLLNADELNPDESQFIAGAITLRHDPVFWRSVDGMTAGPLVYYALLPLSYLGLTLDFFTARLTGMLLLWATLWIAYRTLREHYGEANARLGLMPGALFIAAVRLDDLHHYSAELVTLPLVAGLLLLVTRQFASAAPDTRACLGTGLLAGLLPWAKMQAAPVGAVLILAGLVSLATSARLTRAGKTVRCAAMLAGTLLPAAMVCAVVWLAGIWTEFYRCYIVQNLYYSNIELPVQWMLPDYLHTDPVSLVVLIFLGTPLVLIILVACLGRRPGALFVISGPVFAAAVFCVIYPHRNFLHYTLLLLVPLIIWGGAALGESQRRSEQHPWIRRAGLGLLLAGTGALAFFRGAGSPPPMIGHLWEHWNHSATELGGVIDVITRRGEKLAVWGWYAQAYPKQGLIQGTRSAYSVWSILENPQRDYHRRIFLEDFRRSRPEVFVDSVGPNSIFMQNRVAYGHETFPALNAEVARDYRLVIDLGYARVYGRQDILLQRRITPTVIRRSLGATRPPIWVYDHLAQEDLHQTGGRFDRINGQDVRLMHPPSQLGSNLKGNEREVVFDYGYDPRALREKSGNGTEFITELVAADGTIRRVESFRYNPAHLADPSPVGHRRIPLPLLEPGTRLVIRTAPGPDNNDAWDWAYITGVKFLRSPEFTFRQFPGFNRIPDFGSSPLSSFVPVRGAPAILLHAPSVFGFVLTGAERQLRFAYGFVPAAYNRAEPTDGAIFTVQVLPPEGPPTVLARRRLVPVERLADQGIQTMKVTLPNLPAGSRLQVNIRPGPSNACDWTFVTDLRLD